MGTSETFDRVVPSVLDLLDLLIEHDASVDLRDPMFLYDRTSRKVLAEESSLRFEPHEAPCSIRSAVFHENRANISMRVKVEGTLHLDVEGKPRLLPSTVCAYQWRTFSLVTDGVVHLDVLPVTLSLNDYEAIKHTELYHRLNAAGAVRGVSPAGVGHVKLVFVLEGLELTNESLRTAPSGRALLDRELELLRFRIEQKVYNHYRRLHAKPSGDPSLVYVFGEAEAKWLADQGFRAGLFQPKTARAEATDSYKVVEMQTFIKSFNSLPKVEEVLSRHAVDKPLTPSMEAMLPTVLFCEAQSRAMSVPEFESFIERQAAHTTIVVRRLICEVARRKYAVLLAKTWFVEAQSHGELFMKVRHGSRDFECAVKLVEVDVGV